MKILVAWDSESELELISMYLGIEENEVTAAIGAEAFEAQIASGDHFDVVLMCIDMPDVDSGYALFDRFRKESPNSPVVGACRAEEVIRIIKFMANGMKAYVIRDTSGDFMFMLHAVLNSTIDAVRSARNEELAEKLREEVESVRKLQQSVIPKRVDAPDGYEIIGRYEPSQIRVLGGQRVTMAGGDYYDVFRLPDDNIVLLVGDASGHGMKAAMSIMTMHTLVRMIRTHEYRDTAHFVEVINKQLCEQSIVSEEGGFITMLYAILDVQKGELQWTSAGHPPPIVQNFDTGVVELVAGVEAGGLPLAIMDGAEYEVYTTTVPPNARVMLFTDGIEEAFPDNAEVHDQFGVDGIIRTLRETADLPLEDALQRLFDASSEYTQGAGRHDDTSVVLFDRRQ